ncbi:alpha/beta hydrolase [Sphingomonas sanxanigenens]
MRMANVDRRTMMAGALGAAAVPALARAEPASRDPDAMIRLWPGRPPGSPATLPVEQIVERSTDPAMHDRAMTRIAAPRMALFRPAKPNGAAVLITPGGGYARVVIDKEGYELAPLLADRGITSFVLFYRLPADGWTTRPDAPLADAQRAMRLIRHRAAEFGIDPARVAAMGFSAGGHVCADLAARFSAPVYAPVDAADRLPARPMLAAPIYPVVSMSLPNAHPGSRTNLLGDAPTAELERAHSPDRNVPADAPPCFLVHAEDDETVPVANSLLLRQALRDRGIPVDTHLFAEGGHGFGIRRIAGKPAAAWPELYLSWAMSRGLFAA